MNSNDDDIQDVKRMLLGIQGTILGLAIGSVGSIESIAAALVLLLGAVIFLISLSVTILAR